MRVHKDELQPDAIGAVRQADTARYPRGAAGLELRVRPFADHFGINLPSHRADAACDPAIGQAIQDQLALVALLIQTRRARQAGECRTRGIFGNGRATTLSYPYYIDGGYKIYGFNNIVWDRSNDYENDPYASKVAGYFSVFGFLE